MESLLILGTLFIPLIIGVYFIAGGARLPKWILQTGFMGALLYCLCSSLHCAAVYLGAVKGAYGYAFIDTWQTGLEFFGIHLQLGLSGVSIPLYLLAGLVGLTAGLCAIQTKVERLHLYLGLLLIMQSGLMGMFASIDIFYMYFFHELALVPTFILIGLWGGRNRGAIAMELTIYLSLGALLGLLGLLAIYWATGAGTFSLITLREYLDLNPIGNAAQTIIFGCLLFGLGILVSLFPFYTWAPKGYAAAPTPLSMLHAGVLKKFGLYALIQIALPLLPAALPFWSPWMLWLALGNIVIVGLITIAQKDLKQMLGYSSVMHMGYCFLGIACLSYFGVQAAVLVMFAHGLSIALFFLISGMVYERTGTWEMQQMGGLSKQAPVLCAFFVAAVFASIGLPGFMNFWGELMVFFALWPLAPWAVALAILGVVISALYGLRAIASIFFGPQKVTGHIQDLTFKERVPLFILVAALVVTGFWPKAITQYLNTPPLLAVDKGITESAADKRGSVPSTIFFNHESF